MPFPSTIRAVISRIAGEVVRVDDGAAEIRAGGIVYEVLIPAADEERLRGQVGETVEFHTLHYLEGQGQGSSFWPRLVGFRSPLERDFFELFTTVKGIGNRKALRALQMPFGMVAELIARRDVAMLTTLPEIGRKTAESIVVELKGKVERFTVLGRGTPGDDRFVAGPLKRGSAPAPSHAATAPATKAAGRRAPAATTTATQPTRADAGRSTATNAPTSAAPAAAGGSPFSDAIEILVQLGESRLAARQLVERALDRDPEIGTADQLVAAALRAR